MVGTPRYFPKNMSVEGQRDWYRMEVARLEAALKEKDELLDFMFRLCRAKEQICNPKGSIMCEECCRRLDEKEA